MYEVSSRSALVDSMLILNAARTEIPTRLGYSTAIK